MPLFKGKLANEKRKKERNKTRETDKYLTLNIGVLNPIIQMR
jgi:hypothetical protein